MATKQTIDVAIDNVTNDITIMVNGQSVVLDDLSIMRLNGALAMRARTIEVRQKLDTMRAENSLPFERGAAASPRNIWEG